MEIAGRKIGSGHPPYIIGELSCNHNGSIDNAILLIKAAKDAGADAAKLQAYTAETLTLDHDSADFVIKDGPWKGRRLHELYSRTQTPFEWFPQLFAYGKEIGITVLASVFSPEAVDMLERLDCPAYKIASMEIVDTPLIAYAAKTWKPIIISTGMASDEEIKAAAPGFLKVDYTAYLHCVSGYPTNVEEANLGRMNDIYCLLALWHDPIIGISDHTLGWEIPVAATALGARIIEKHLTLSRSINTEDRDFSLEPAEFAQMCAAVRAIWQAMPPSKPKSEESSRQLRRSLYAVSNIKKGEKFTSSNIRSIRPSYGLPPRELPRILDKRASCDIQYGSALRWEHVSK